jgi:hypothetical protein
MVTPSIESYIRAFRSSLTSGLLPLAGAIAALVAMTAPASAQLSLPAATQTAASMFVRGVDAAYDSKNNVYLVVGGSGPVVGVFVNTNGAALGAPFTIKTSDGYGSFPRVAYSPQANGGNGAFLVAWASEDAQTLRRLRGRMVAYPGTLLGSETIISGTASTWTDVGSHDLDYSPTSQRFFAAWKSMGGLDGSGSNGSAPVKVYGVAIDTNANAIGSPVALSSGFGRDPGVAWSSATDDFGVSFSGEGSTTVYSAFVKVPASNPAAFTRYSFNEMPQSSAMTAATDIAFNPQTGRFVMAWYQIDGGGLKAQIAEFNASASLVTTGTASFQIGSYDALSMAYNGTSGTHLLVGLNRVNDTLLGAELNGNGYRFAAEVSLSQTHAPARYTRVTSRTGAAQWLSTFAGNSFVTIAAQAVATGATNGGPAGSYASGGGGSTGGGSTGGSTGGCTTVSPGAGWTCVNGGWLPPSDGGSTGGSTGSCTTVNPGAGFSCVDGSWIYTGATSGGSTGGSTGGCTTVNPGAGFTCVNGSWIYTGDTSGGATGGSTGSCTTVYPGAGFSCVNGSWIYTGDTSGGATGGSTGSCTTVYPGAGFSCVNGSWIYTGATSGGSTSGSTGSCTTVYPGTGFSCVNGSWIYTGETSGGSTGSCTTVYPGAGFSCVNGSWLYTGATSSGSTGGCTTTNPGPAFSCVNGSWVYTGGSGSTSSCTTVSPGSGWTCLNGNWLPPGYVSLSLESLPTLARTFDVTDDRRRAPMPTLLRETALDRRFV